jgi:acyl-CoA thioester hydrolase
MGVAHHTHYLVWFELGRTELMRGLGCPYGEVEDGRRLFFPVVEVGASFRAPALYDEVVVVDTRLSQVNAARVRFEYTITRQEDSKVLATGYSVHGVTGEDGRPRRMPADLRGKLQEAGAGMAKREKDHR